MKGVVSIVVHSSEGRKEAGRDGDTLCNARSSIIETFWDFSKLRRTIFFFSVKELSPTDLWSGVKGRGSIILGCPGGLEADSDFRDNCTSELQLLKLGAKDCFMPLHYLTMPLTLPEGRSLLWNVLPLCFLVIFLSEVMWCLCYFFRFILAYK